MPRPNQQQLESEIIQLEQQQQKLTRSRAKLEKHRDLRMRKITPIEAKRQRIENHMQTKLGGVDACKSVYDKRLLSSKQFRRGQRDTPQVKFYGKYLKQLKVLAPHTQALHATLEKLQETNDRLNNLQLNLNMLNKQLQTLEADQTQLDQVAAKFDEMSEPSDITDYIPIDETAFEGSDDESDEELRQAIEDAKATQAFAVQAREILHSFDSKSDKTEALHVGNTALKKFATEDEYSLVSSPSSESSGLLTSSKEVPRILAQSPVTGHSQTAMGNSFFAVSPTLTASTNSRSSSPKIEDEWEDLGLDKDSKRSLCRST